MEKPDSSQEDMTRKLGNLKKKKTVLIGNIN